MLEISEQLQKRIAKYPELKEEVDDFIKNDGCNPDPGYLTVLTVLIRELKVDEPSFFDWDEDTADDFYSWGHNSRYGNVLEPMLYNDLEGHVTKIVDYLDRLAFLKEATGRK